MNESPPPNDGLEDVDERYRRLSDRDSSRPSEKLRSAILRHASELAVQARAPESSAPIQFRRHAANGRWRVATYGGLAAAALAGLLIAPHFLTPSTLPMTRLSPLPVHSQEPAAEKAATPAATPAAPQAFAGKVRPSPSPALGPAAGADTRRAPRAQGPARDSASPPQVAQTQAMPAAPAARAMASSPRPAAASATAESLDAPAALREAAQSGNVQRLEALLTERIDIDARDTNGRSALMLAVLHDRKDAVNSLLAAGADPNAADTNGTTPLEAAIAGARPEIAAALRRAGAR
jgi:ankyrin repeat protein